VYLFRALHLETPTCEERDKWLDAFRYLKSTHSTMIGSVFNVTRGAYLDVSMNWADLERKFVFNGKLGQGGYCEVFRGAFEGGFEVAVKIFKREEDEKNDGKEGPNAAGAPPVKKTPSSSDEKVDKKAAAAPASSPTAVAGSEDKKDDAHRDYTDDLRREIEVLKVCRHAHLVSYYGCYGPDSKQRLWVLMEFADAGALTDYLPYTGSLRERDDLDAIEMEKWEKKVLKEKEKAGEKIDKVEVAAKQKERERQKEARKKKRALGEYWLSESQIAYILGCTLRALMYLHSRNIVHRGMEARSLPYMVPLCKLTLSSHDHDMMIDVKGANILLTKRGDVKLTDFGIAKIQEAKKKKKKDLISEARKSVALARASIALMAAGQTRPGAPPPRTVLPRGAVAVGGTAAGGPRASGLVDVRATLKAGKAAPEREQISFVNRLIARWRDKTEKSKTKTTTTPLVAVTSDTIVIDDDDDDEEEEAFESSAGSPLWMSCEAHMGMAVGPKTDVWSLGMTALEMVGQLPYTNLPLNKVV
jgi:serine/threonine protein kinase